MMQKIIIILGILLLAGCSEPPKLPEAKALSVSLEQIKQIPFVEMGSYKVTVDRNIKLINTKLERDLEVSAFYPEQGSGFPLIIFSPGNFSTKDKYDNVINHWVSHGYVVLAMEHQDCCGMVKGIINSLWYGDFGLVEQRMFDTQFLLSQLHAIQLSYPQLRDKFDPENIAAAGHSFGGFSAQQLGGAGTFNPDDDQYHFYSEPKIKAIVALSPPGPMFDVITAQSWQKLTTPTLITTGTWDFDGRFFKTWDVHKMSFDTAVPNDKFALVVEGADHYLGNLICRPEREVAPQTDALNMVNAVTTQFLNSYLKQDAVSEKYLSSAQITQDTAGFATLSLR